MQNSKTIQGAGIAALAILIASPALLPGAEARSRSGQIAAPDNDRPLTVTRRHRNGYPGIYRHGNHIVAIGGFSANGYGYGHAGRGLSSQASRNALLRYQSSGVYGYGGDGLGGVGVTDFEEGYNNPSYGPPFSRYVGFNGVPSNLAFGPAFAFRRYADQDDGGPDIPTPSPQDLGYGAVAPDEPE